MKNILRTLAALLLVTASQLVPAQLFRAYLSTDGSDANPCTLPSPCRLLPAALAAVADGGEIWMLDSANYNTGPVAIGKSVTILAVPGVVGSVVALGGNAIDIAAAGLKVTLRNLNILPFTGNAAMHGIHISALSELRVLNCMVSGFTGGSGVNATAQARVSIDDTVITRNSTGVSVQDSAILRAARSHFDSNSIGLLLQGALTATRASIAHSTFNDNNQGIQIFDQSGTKSMLSVLESQASGNQVGISTTGGLLAIANSQLSDNRSKGMHLTGSATWAVLQGNQITSAPVGVHASTAAVVILRTTNLGQNTTSWIADNGATAYTFSDNFSNAAPSGNTLTTSGQ